MAKKVEDVLRRAGSAEETEDKMQTAYLRRCCHRAYAGSSGPSHYSKFHLWSGHLGPRNRTVADDGFPSSKRLRTAGNVIKQAGSTRSNTRQIKNSRPPSSPPQ